jgi:Kef-type K+ transport system membrane component KefB
VQADSIPLIVGLIVLFSSLISIRIGLSVAIIEIALGSLAGNWGIQPEQWMSYLAGFGGVLLTYLAGTEIDTVLLREKFKESFRIGLLSFLLPFLGVFSFAYFVMNWSYNAALIAGVALSTTSLAVVYSVLVETGLSNTEIGKMLMASTFITDMGTALALSVLFVKPSLYTLIFISVSINVIYFADKFSHYFFSNRRWINKVIEPEIKYVFVLLLAFMYFANLGEGMLSCQPFFLG